MISLTFHGGFISPKLIPSSLWTTQDWRMGEFTRSWHMAPMSLSLGLRLWGRYSLKAVARSADICGLERIGMEGA